MYYNGRHKTCKDRLSNISFVYKDWLERGFFKQQKARTDFLKWVLKIFYNRNNKEVSKMYYDVLNYLDKSLLTDKKIIRQLSSSEKKKLNAILKAGRKTAKLIRNKNKVKVSA